MIFLGACKVMVHEFLLISRRLKSSLPGSQTKMKVFTQTKNPITGDTEWDMQDEDYDYHQEIARSAFADMLHDTERNQKYYKALKIAIEKMHAVGKKANVLDIGTGTGLLSIMAAKCGADSIVACEAFQPMAECCLKILEKNGVADQITVIPKRSTELTVGEDGDLKEKANILVTEVFDTELIGEGALSTFSHAHKYLLETDCIVVPDSAIMYAQIVECPTLQKWNKLNDLADEDLNVILRAPQKMRNCAGSAAVHDVQLSQLPRQSFRELSDQIPVFHYDWSGKTSLEFKRTDTQQIKATGSGNAQVVFMWWELKMDQEGKIILSCAPWWTHPDANLLSERPQDSIPWRDHWMQAVYYLPQTASVTKNSEITLISCQDEYSLWFYVENDSIKYNDYMRPICECGVHMSFSRTHVSYLNDGRRSKKFLSRLKEDLNNKSVVLDLNGASFMGLAAAKMGAKKVYVLENMNLHVNILKDYAKENSITNVEFFSQVTEDLLKEVTHVIADPNFSNAILPWENLKMAYLLHSFKGKLNNNVTIIPEKCEFWGMPVEFQDLHKIRIPLKKCEGIDMTIFDALVENSRTISDMELEAQPLWEYPCRARSTPKLLLDIDLSDLRQTYASDGTHEIDNETSQPVNGFAVWAVWTVGGRKISTGPVDTPELGAIVNWDPHTRQAVKILKKATMLNSNDSWTHQTTCDLAKGQFDLDINIAKRQ